VFVTLPLAFARIPGGLAAALGFFLLLVVAAIASGISMLEVPVAALSRRGWSRARATVATAAACWVSGLATVLSFNLLHSLAALFHQFVLRDRLISRMSIW
jgi:neurotransmitter:Na+ symporter, NSS family